MPRRGKQFELLDFPKFARPSVLDVQGVSTARELINRLVGQSFMSYGALWPRIDLAVRGLATDAFIRTAFSAYDEEWKNENLQEVFTLLRNFFGGRGTWYREPPIPKYVLGFWFKPSIKGIWFVNGRAYAVAINPRKGQPLTVNDARFIARGVYELHCIDDPNNPLPLIIDLSAPTKAGRVLRSYPLSAGEAVSLESFEQSVRDFLAALTLAGISLPAPPDLDSVVNLFRR